MVVGFGVWGLHVASIYLLARRVASASALYGSLGVAAAILAWLYLLGRLLVAAAMLNATLWERRAQQGHETHDDEDHEDHGHDDHAAATPTA